MGQTERKISTELTCFKDSNGVSESRGFYVRNLRTDVISWKGVGKSCSIEIRLLLIALC